LHNDAVKPGIRRLRMAENFQIYCFKNRDSLHLKLSGDFDGSSAYELINTLLTHGKGFYEIFIDTNDLKSIHPFGRDVFQKNLSSSNKLYRNLVFIGKNRNAIGTI
jgi:hypothetical protein